MSDRFRALADRIAAFKAGRSERERLREYSTLILTDGAVETILEALTAAEERDALKAKLEAAEAAMDNATSRLCGDYCGATCNDMHDIIREALAKLRGSEVKP